MVGGIANILHRDTIAMIVGGKTFERGEQCFTAGRVLGVESVPGQLCGIVKPQETGRSPYEIRIWIPGTCSNAPGTHCNTNQQCNAPGFCRTDDAQTLAEAACCDKTVDQVITDIGLPNVFDGGNLIHGNLQIHPQTGNPNNNSTCPIP